MADKPFTCPACNETFASKEALEQHKREHHE
ncbi:MAG: C2H2-type zinc finger protein [Candidatus Thermoplasmatota archaeon]|nr:C2H2-type zinc finger protein [Candidatus Thermoplasmatota archaeon]